jgi:hypothetical protein
MNTEQIKDMHLLYNAVYDEELREQFEEYNNTIYDEDIVEVATEYFYSYGLNADGIDILIENVGLESFVEYVYELSEDLYVLTEERAAKKRTGGKSYDEVMAGINAREAKAAAKKSTKKKVTAAASGKKEEERTQPESRGAESEAKAEQPKSKKPERKSIADRISNAIKSGVERHNNATATAGRLAGETGKTLGKLAKGVGSVAGQFGSGAGTVGKASKKVLFGEEVEAWVNQLVEEGYDLSEYTWDEMVEIYLGEGVFSSKSSGAASADAADQAAETHKTVADAEHTSSSGRKKYRNAAARLKVTARRMRRSEQNEEFDIYDTILSHLLDEGYAESVEEAEVIMVNMSEDWRDSIVEAKVDNGKSEKEKRQIRTARGGRAGVNLPNSSLHTGDIDRRDAHRTRDDLNKDIRLIRKGKTNRPEFEGETGRERIAYVKSRM